ncbi:MAG: serine hydrolase [Cyclobacteriaceae bacterium]|nr:serine hydrolase [Cyclobacteriaceae bacterium]
MGLRVKELFVLLFIFSSHIEIVNSQPFYLPPVHKPWVDSIMSTMTVEEKIGQLMMIATYSNQNETQYRNVELLIEKYHAGGLVFFQGTPVKQAELTNRYQRISRIPLLIGMDAEWGAGMRLDSIRPLPKHMTLGAITDENMIYNYAAEIARQCKLLGVHVNFAPVLDVNNNASNPVINVRSFGEDPLRVAGNGIAFMNGLQAHGILAVGKHFPGHGDTDTDSHHALPVIRHSIERMDSIEMVPFKRAVEGGMDGIMAAHLNIPALENDPSRPASLSENIIHKTLRLRYGFQGLVFTDAMNMRGVTSVFPSGKAELEAFKAGCDILLMPVNVPAVLETFINALAAGEITEKMIDEKLERILFAKYKVGLHRPGYPNPAFLVRKLNRNVETVSRGIYEQAITLVNNQDNLLPFHLIDTAGFASLTMNPEKGQEKNAIFDNYIHFDHFTLNRKFSGKEIFQQTLADLEKYNTVIVSLYGLNTNSKRNYGINSEDVEFIRKLSQATRVVLIVYGIPYSLNEFAEIEHLVCGYEDGPFSRSTVPQLLFGAIPFRGKLPVRINEMIPAGHGLTTQSLGRLGFSTPEAEGFNTDHLTLIDSLIADAIRDKSIPGCQVLIARNGRVIFQRNYGYQTYENLIPVEDNSLYDLASVTKVAGSVQALMMLYDRGFVDLDKKISHYLPELKNTNKENMTIRDMLTHQAGLLPYYPFWMRTMKRYDPANDYYSNMTSADFPVEVTPELFVRHALKDTLWNWMINTELLKKEDPLKPYEYKYSDMGFYLLQRLIENITGWPLDKFLSEYLYEPMGVTYLSYLPHKKFTTDWIIPSGIDKTFRNGKIQGNVHDEIAAMYGGVAGHAGLFSNAYELSKIMQMNLQGGYYGGITYFRPGTINEFTRRQFRKNRRGIGWDKPQIIGDEYNPASFYASEDSYGHSGFTGTYVWVDPEYDLIYVFLSNRTYPDVDNRKLIEQDTRKRIQTVIYSAIINYKR